MQLRLTRATAAPPPLNRPRSPAAPPRSPAPGGQLRRRGLHAAEPLPPHRACRAPQRCALAAAAAVRRLRLSARAGPNQRLGNPGTQANGVGRKRADRGVRGQLGRFERLRETGIALRRL